MRSVLSLSLLVSSAQPLPAQPATIPWAAIVLLDCGSSLGTAFHIGDGRYITANHVVADSGGSCTVGRDKFTVVAQIEGLDIAELRGPDIAAKFEINCSGFSVGKQYLAIGYALGRTPLTDIPLLYSSTFGRGIGTNNGMFIGADLIPGMSGGPLIGDDFRVWGVNQDRWPSRARDLADSYLCGKALT